MSSASVSFRISRSAEDLAGTLHLLSQRLVQLERRLAALEALQAQPVEDDPAMLERLGNAERLLVDCRDLLGGALDVSKPDPHAVGEDPGRMIVSAADADGEGTEFVGLDPQALWEEEAEGEELAA